MFVQTQRVNEEILACFRLGFIRPEGGVVSVILLIVLNGREGGWSRDSSLSPHCQTPWRQRKGKLCFPPSTRRYPQADMKLREKLKGCS